MTQARPGLADGVDWRLYYVTDTALSGGPQKVPHLVEQAVLGGAGVVQIRDKDLPGHEFLTLAKAWEVPLLTGIGVVLYLLLLVFWLTVATRTLRMLRFRLRQGVYRTPVAAWRTAPGRRSPVWH